MNSRWRRDVRSRFWRVAARPAREWTALCLGLALIGQVAVARAQVEDSTSGSEDQRYYDFWPGTWYRVVDGAIDTTGTRFNVRRVYDAAFEETWRLVVDSTTTIAARALRAWDRSERRWRYVWISESGHFQVWEGRQVDGDWFLYNEFDIDGERVLSRQAWIPRGADRLVRISEHSRDGGRTWEERFREEYERIRQ